MGNNMNTGVIQMMLPVLSSEYFVYHHMQSTVVVRVYGRQPDFIIEYRMDAFYYATSQGCSEETRLFLLGLMLDAFKEKFAQEKSRKSATESSHDQMSQVSTPDLDVHNHEPESERIETGVPHPADLEPSTSSQCLTVKTSENSASDLDLAKKRLNRKRKHHSQIHTSTKKARLDFNNNNNALDVPVTETLSDSCSSQNEAVTQDLVNNNSSNNNNNDTCLDAPVTSRNDPVTYDCDKNAPVTQDFNNNNNNNYTSLDARLEQFFVFPQTNRLIPKHSQPTQNTRESESGSDKAKHSHEKTKHRSEKVKPKQPIQRLRSYRKERSLLKAATIRCLVRKALETGTYCCYKRCFLARPRLYV